MIQIARAIGPSCRSTRSFISCAALFVNVIARISFGFTPQRREQVRDAVGEDAGLPRARAGDHEQRPFGGQDRLPLGGIQVGEVGLRLDRCHLAHGTRQVSRSSSLSSHDFAAASASGSADLSTTSTSGPEASKLG